MKTGTRRSVTVRGIEILIVEVFSVVVEQIIVIIPQTLSLRRLKTHVSPQINPFRHSFIKVFCILVKILVIDKVRVKGNERLKI